MVRKGSHGKMFVLRSEGEDGEGGLGQREWNVSSFRPGKEHGTAKNTKETVCVGWCVRSGNRPAKQVTKNAPFPR